MQRILLAGAGFMGSAVARAMKRSDLELQFGIVEKSTARREEMVAELAARDFSASPDAGLSWCQLVVLAVKPQDAVAACEALVSQPHQTPVVSVLAGTPIERVASLMRTPQVIRVMPNLAAAIGRAVSGIAYAAEVPDETRSRVASLLTGMGTLIEIRETLMHAITGASGSAIAYVFRFIEALALGAVEQGLPWSQALVVATDVVESAAQLLRHEAVHPAELVARVSSPGGTTIAGIRELEEGGHTATVMAAVRAAAERSRELSP